MASFATIPQDEQQSDTRSEVSSVESDWSDLKSIAAQLGVTDLDNLHTERFKIDRQKLSDMIKTEAYEGGKNVAEQFFSNVMCDTMTHISWPCRLKLGAKTKKDPHVRIIGHKEDVLQAKHKIMIRLNARGNRVIIKMDVSYTDHSYIIGKGGSSIQKIMEETRTHIHFPDSNRLSPTEKSNQVSICGEVQGVENARSRIRLSTPLLYSFELPILAPGRPQPDNETPFVKEIEREFNVQIIFSNRPKLHSALVLVKGIEMDVPKVKEATQRLIDLIYGEISSQIPVQMQLEISVQHHPIVVGRMSSNLREIMNKTNCKIIFPDANDVNIKPIKRSQITITGSIDGTYLARQLLIGNLPIALIFDFPESNIDAELVNKLMYTYDVFIVVRQKSRQSTLCIIIKGIEKFITNMYEARYQLLKMTGPRVLTVIPPTYFSSSDQANERKSSIVPLLAASTANNNLQSLSPLPPSNWMLPGSRLSQSYTMTSTSMPNISNIKDVRGYANNNNNNNIDMNLNVSPRNISISSGYQSINCSTSSLENNGFNAGGRDFNIDLPNKDNLFNDLTSDTSSALNDSLIYNFDRRLVSGYNAMKTFPSEHEIRTPTRQWQGLGLSKTYSYAMERKEAENPEWSPRTPTTPFAMTTSFVDAIPKPQRDRLSQYNDVISILANIGLAHHIQHFINGEIDLAVFATLTDNDLLNLGVRTLGARRRILMAVHDVAARQSNSRTSLFGSTSVFSGSAAPGAERRGSTGNI